MGGANDESYGSVVPNVARGAESDNPIMRKTTQRY